VRKLVIEVKQNEGAMRDLNPHVPWTAEEIGEDAAACRAAGASLVHFHPRHADGAPDTSAGGTAAALRAIRERSDVLTLPAAANAHGAPPAARIANVTQIAGDGATRADFLGVEMGGANLDMWDPRERRLLSEGRAFANDNAAIRELLDAAREHGFAPYLVAFNVSWMRAIEVALDAGWAGEPAVVGVILGGERFVAAHPATLRGLDALVDFLPAGRRVEWIACAHGANALAIAAAAIARGGHVGIGLGDHPYPELGRPTNAELVARVADMARAMGREVAAPDEARELLGAVA